MMEGYINHAQEDAADCSRVLRCEAQELAARLEAPLLQCPHPGGIDVPVLAARCPLQEPAPGGTGTARSAIAAALPVLLRLLSRHLVFVLEQITMFLLLVFVSLLWVLLLAALA